MTNLIFKYRKKKIDGEIFLTPIIKFFMTHGPYIFEGAGVLDSGSDITVLPKGVAEILHLNLEKKEEIYGLGKQPIEIRKSKVKIDLIDRRRKKYSNIIPVVVRVDDTEEDSEIIVGRAGIFNKFDITFKESEYKIIFKPFSNKKLLF